MKTPAPDPTELACRELVELATDYLEHRLPLAARARLEMHLCTCAPCKVYLRQLRVTIETAGRLDADDLPAGPREALLAAFREWKKTI